MIHNVFTVYDQKAGAYLPPWIMPKIEMAKRVFGDCVNSPEHQFGAHPEDYTLFDLGHFDDETAMFMAQPNGPQTLGNGLEFVREVDSDSQMELLEATEGHRDAETTETPTPVGNGSSVQSGPTSEDTSQ